MIEAGLHHTPHLTTAVTGPLQLLETELLGREQDIETWFAKKWEQSPAPLYGSVDLRNAGFKLAPVDMNLFPAGFNNIRLNSDFVPLAIDAAKSTLQRLSPEVNNILLIPENHTRNPFYWENIQSLLEILTGAGVAVKVGSLLPELQETKKITCANGGDIFLEPIKRHENRIGVDHFDPDIILLNNDLSDGIPTILQGLEQPILPPAELGWSQRLKSEHFQYYADVSTEFASHFQIDPWLIAPLFRHCGEVDFMRREGEACLVTYVEQLLEMIQQKYQEYHIPHQPYVVVKADAGTYGMAVMMVRHADEIRSLNRKQRTNMAKSKGGQPVRSVIVQEGVYTFEKWGVDDAVAEPVVYLWGERVIGGFYRLHKDKGVDENLNSPGMHFEPLVFARSCHRSSPVDGKGVCQNRFYVYGVIARLSMLAAAREML